MYVHAINNVWESAIFALAAPSNRRRLYLDSLYVEKQNESEIYLKASETKQANRIMLDYQKQCTL